MLLPQIESGKFEPTATRNEIQVPTGNMSKKLEPKRSLTPLWVITSFVSLTEIIAGIAASKTSGAVQDWLTAFVCLFPFSIAVAFFAVLWARPYVFYPPTDFGSAQDVQSYVQAMQGKAKEVSPSGKPDEKEKEIQPAPALTKQPEPEVKANLEPDQPELNLTLFQKMHYYALMDEIEKLEETFKKLQSESQDPEERILNEAQYLELRFRCGDETAQEKLHELEKRAKEFPKTLGIVYRADARCYAFSGDNSRAAERFKESAKACVTESGRAESIIGAAKSLFESGGKRDAFAILKQYLPKFVESQPTIQVCVALADLFELEKDNFNRAVVLQKALQIQPNSKQLNFKTAYAFSDAGMNALALLHYEKLLDIDFHYPNAHNNLGVAFTNLGAPSKAIGQYRIAIGQKDTLAASNFANVLIGIGDLDEAEKLLKDAQAKKDVHENVNESIVTIDKNRKKDEETRTHYLQLAKRQHNFLLQYAEAFLRPESVQPQLDGSWHDAEGKSIELKVSQPEQELEITWSEGTASLTLLNPGPTRFRFKGKPIGPVMRGELTKAENSMLNFSGSQNVETFVRYGQGYIFFPAPSELQLFVQKADSAEFKQIFFRRAT